MFLVETAVLILFLQTLQCPIIIILMRYQQRLKKEIVPEWEDCYINYRTLKVLLRLVRTTTIDRLDIEKSIANPAAIDIPPHTQPIVVDLKGAPISNQSKEGYVKIRDSNDKAHKLFLDTFQKQKQLYEEFARFKMREIENRYTKALQYAALPLQDEKRKKQNSLTYIQCLYIETSNLSHMHETNCQIQRRILNKLELHSYEYYQVPRPSVPEILDTHRLNYLLKQMQEQYITLSKRRIKRSRKRIRGLASERIKTTKDSFIIGLMVGIFIAVCTFLAVMLIYLKNQVQTTPIFNQDFATWRGIALFIIYVWVLGVNLHHYEKFNVNHRNIMENDSTNYPVSTGLFKIAGFFSTLLVALFVLYALDVGDLISLQKMNPQILPMFVWLPFIAFLVNPISIFYYKSITYVYKLLLKCLISFAILVTYPIVHATDQFLSLLTPIRDTFHTICYYAHFERTFDNQESLQNYDCKPPVSIAIFVFTMVIFCYRIMQCIKCGIQAKPYNKFDFLNALKYVVAMISSILSYVLDNDRDRIFPPWLVFAILTSAYTFFWDLKFDWLLLQKGTYRFLLRDRLVYSKKMYYFLIVLNLFLRCSWTLTLSNNIVQNFLGSPQVFILLFSFLELVRRGVWNMLSVEAEHLKNCMQLRALPLSFFKRQDEIERMLLASKQSPNNNSLQRLSNMQNIAAKWQPSKEKQLNEEFQKIKQKVKTKEEEVKKVKLFVRETNCEDLELIDYLFDEADQE